MNKVVAIAGSILADIINQIDRYPECGRLANVSDISQSVGGCVCNTAIDLKRLDPNMTVRVYGKVGKDENGAFVRSRMEAEGLDVRGVRVDDSGFTSFTDVMTLPNGDRTFFCSRGVNARFGLRDIDVSALDCDLFHLGYLLLLDEFDAEDREYGTVAARILHDVRERGIRTSIDLVSEQSDRFQKVITASLPHCDYVIINEVEGGSLSGISPRDEAGQPVLANLEKICAYILEQGVHDTVVIHCPELSCCMGRDKRFIVLPSLQLPQGYIRGAVGAGDAFCAGMLYSFANGIGAEEGMRIASCAAACNLAAPDSVGGAKSLRETMRLNELFERRNLQ